MASRIKLKKLAIQGVREPGQRMPIGLIVGGECPLDRVPVEPVLNVNVLGDIAIVVVIDERMMNRRVVKSERWRLQGQGQERMVDSLFG